MNVYIKTFLFQH